VRLPQAEALVLVGERELDVDREPAAKLRSMITASGLGNVSGHFDYDGLESKLDYAKAL